MIAYQRQKQPHGLAGVRLSKLCAVNNESHNKGNWMYEIDNLFRCMYSAEHHGCFAMKKCQMKVYTGDAGHPDGLTKASVEEM